MSLATVRLVVDGRRIMALDAPYECRLMLRAIPGAIWSKAGRVWTYPVSEAAAFELTTRLRRSPFVGAVEVDPEVGALVLAHEGSRAVLGGKSAPGEAVPPVPLPQAPGTPEHWEHQRRAFHFAVGQSARLLAIGMGGGKSRVAVDLCRAADARLVLILCPKNVVGVWPRQFGLYAPERFDITAPRKGTVAKRAEEVAAAIAHAKAFQAPRVIVVNYDSAWREPLGKLLLAQVWDYVILDESHRIKSARGKASSFCAKLRVVAKRRLCLTGTPMPHSPLDVFGQYRFLDPGIFGTSFVGFRAQYARMGGYGGHEVLGYQREGELAEKVYSIGYRIADEELDAALGLLEPIHETRTCELSPKARRTYDEFAKETFAMIGDGTISAKNVLVQLLRLQQMTSGFVPVETVDDEERVETTVTEIDTAKRDALVDLLEDVPPDEQVVVFCRFVHDLDAVQTAARQLDEKRGRTYAELSARRRDALTEDSTLSPVGRINAVQIQSGGVGVDFSAASYCVFYSVGFSLSDFLQAERRLHRPGQRGRVAFYHLIAEHTVDEHVYEALRQRKEVVDYILGLSE